MKGLIVITLLLAVVLGVGRQVARPAGTRAAEPRSLSLEVQRPGGPPVLLEFQVAAASAEDAYAAAALAAQTLVPGGRISPGGRGVSAQFAFWGWKWDDNELPVHVAYNPTGGPGGVAPSVVLSALQGWSAVPTSRFAFAYAGVTDRPASVGTGGPDGENVISWQAFDCSHGCVLGVTSKEQTHEADMVLNSNPEAATQFGIAGGRLDWKTVILHEAGHMAGLEHSCPAPFGVCSPDEEAAVMYYQYRGLLRHLEPDDIAAISALYPSIAPGPTPGASPTPPPGGGLAERTAVFLQRGWNLSVLPQGDIETLTSALSCVDAVYGDVAGSWRAWIRGAAAPLQSLSSVDGAKGYWLLASEACAHVF
jgi:hypothetical protein